MQFDRGYLSPYFVTNPERMKCTGGRLHPHLREEDLEHEGPPPLLEAIAKRQKPLLIIAEDVEGEALATLVVNKLRGTLHCAAVKAPGFGDRRKEMLKDIAVLTGGQVISEELGLKLENVTISDLGRAKKSSSTRTTPRSSTAPARRTRSRPHQSQIRAPDREHHQRLRPREAPGAPRQARGRRRGHQGRRGHRDRDEGEEGPRRGRQARDPRGRRRGHRPRRRRRAHPRQSALDKITSARSSASASASSAARSRSPSARSRRTRATRARSSSTRSARAQGSFGYNAATGAYGDLIEMGVIDPVKVVRTALQNAASVASLMLTTECDDRGAPQGREALRRWPRGPRPMTSSVHRRAASFTALLLAALAAGCGDSSTSASGGSGGATGGSGGTGGTAGGTGGTGGATTTTGAPDVQDILTTDLALDLGKLTGVAQIVVWPAKGTSSVSLEVKGLSALRGAGRRRDGGLPGRRPGSRRSRFRTPRKPAVDR
jgi:hypothetical protein